MTRLLPTLLLALGGGALATVAGNRTWVRADGAALTALDPAVTGGGGQVPLVSALGLVVLALWGVILVTGHTTRRLLLVLALLAAGGLLTAAVWGLVTVPDDVRAEARAAGLSGAVSVSGWAYACLLGALAALSAACLGWRGVARWGVMGGKYDAPQVRRTEPDSGPTLTGTMEEEGDPSLNLWQSIDRGVDPTRDGS